VDIIKDCKASFKQSFVPWGKSLNYELNLEYRAPLTAKEISDLILDFLDQAIPKTILNESPCQNLKGVSTTFEFNNTPDVKKDLLLKVQGQLENSAANKLASVDYDPTEAVETVSGTILIESEYQKLTPNSDLVFQLKSDRSFELPEFVELKNIKQLEQFKATELTFSAEFFKHTLLTTILRTPPVVCETLQISINNTRTSIKINSTAWNKETTQPYRHHNILAGLSTWTDKNFAVDLISEIKSITSRS
jgi:hypothetical protein